MNNISTSLSHLENSSEFLCSVTDRDMRFLHSNQLFQKYFGLENQNIEGRSFQEVVNSFQVEKFIQAKDACVSQPGKVISIEIKTLNHNEQSWFRWEIIALKDETGSVTEIQFTGTDITKQKKAEQEILQQNILLDNISDAVVSTDLNFCIKSWNFSAEMLLGLNREKAIDKYYADLFKLTTPGNDSASVVEKIITAGFWKGEMGIAGSNGQMMYLQTSISTVKNTNGIAIGYIVVGRDITEEKKVRESLAYKQQQFKSFMENAPLLAWINDEEGTLYFMNSFFKNIFSLSDNAIGQNIFELYPESMRANCKASDEYVMRTNESIETFEEDCDEAGNKIYYKVYKFPVQGRGGRRLIGGQAIDITDMTVSRQELIKEKNQFASFMENTPLLAWIMDENGILHYMNSKYKESSNFSGEELGKDIHYLYPDAIQEKARQSISEVLSSNKNIEYQYSYIDDKGNSRYFNACKFPILSLDGKRFIGGQSIEVTEELLTKKELVKTNERFEYATQATRDVIWDWDIEQNKIQRFGGYNILFGHEMMEDLMEFNTHNIHPEDADAVAQSWQHALNEGASRWQNEFRYRCADGSYKNVIDQAYIIRNEDGKAVRMIGSMQDVTEERRLQKEILDVEVKKKSDVLSAILEAQEKERKEISAELHDNVNQLLAAAMLFLKTASKQTGQPTALIDQGLEYVNKAVNEIRSLSHALNPGALKVNGLFYALSDFTRKITIPGKFEAHLKADISFNEELISQNLKLTLYRIVQESTNNILKHSGADNLLLHLSCRENIVTLSITDNGNGFDAATVKRGMGLVNIYSRAEHAGGSLNIISSPGNGCTIKVDVPLS
ncbi:MAG: PAS domain S-box protein [Ferruginibacter sp.]